MATETSDSERSGTSRRRFLQRSGTVLTGLAGVALTSGRSSAQGDVAYYYGTATVSVFAVEGYDESPDTYQPNAQIVARPPRSGETNTLNLAVGPAGTDDLSQPGLFVVSTAVEYGGSVYQFWEYRTTSANTFQGTLTNTHEGAVPDVNIVLVESDGTAVSKEMAAGAQLSGLFDERSMSVVVQGASTDQSVVFDIRTSGTLA